MVLARVRDARGYWLCQKEACTKLSISMSELTGRGQPTPGEAHPPAVSQGGPTACLAAASHPSLGGGTLMAVSPLNGVLGRSKPSDAGLLWGCSWAPPEARHA